MRFYNKLFTLLLLLFLLIPKGYSQKNDPVFTFSIKSKKLSSVLKTITDLSGKEFSFNPGKIPIDTLVSVDYIDQTLSSILGDLSKYGFSYKFMDKHIILRKSEGLVPNKKEKPNYFTLSGFIRDELSGEVLIGASVGDTEQGLGVIANGYGYYSLTLSEGEYDINCSYVGHMGYTCNIDLNKNIELDFFLNQNISELNEVVIIANNIERSVSKISSGEVEIRNSTIKNIPGAIGESDVLKSLQSLPGISFYSDGSTVFHVRGGDGDQNLILIDEAPIYNPAHLFGLFSAFTPESINSIKIYRGDTPTSFGGRLSSVIDIRLKDGNSNSLIVSGNTSPIATTLNLEGPLFKKNSSFYISARRSHLRWILDLNNSSAERLYFSDFNLKYNYRINRKNRIFLSFYSGHDKFKNKESVSSSSGITWLNNAGTLRWNHIFNNKVFSNTSLIISNYDYNLHTNFEKRERWNTGVGLGALKYDITYFLRKKAKFKAGLYLANHFYSPGNYYIGYQSQPVTRGVSSRQAGESAIYGSGENTLYEKLLISYGLRLTSWHNKGAATEYMYNEYHLPIDTAYYEANKVYNSFTKLEPRLRIEYKISRLVLAKVAWSSNSQFEHLISNSISPFTSLETWLPASPNIKPMHSEQLTSGIVIAGKNGVIICSAEGFYKKMQNYITYADHAQMLFNPHVEEEILNGTGRSYGAEILIKKLQGRINGWMAYTWSRSILNIPGINSGNDYPSPYDRPHSFNTFLNYRIKPKWNISATWTYSTGSPITTPTGFYFYNGYQVPIYDAINNERLANYHRLDLSSEFRLNKAGSRFKHLFKLSVFNLTGNKNPFNINFNKILNESGNLVVPVNHYTSPEIVPSMMYIFGMIPSFSYHFEF
jgi:CarboxypepD_reg-like domain/TonB-dependent Receptor Plug Domain